MKYGNGVSVVDVCEREVVEAKDTLERYGVSKEDADNILDMIEEAYFQLNKAYAVNRAMEKYFKEVTGYELLESSPHFLQRYTKLIAEEEAKYPFRCRRGEQA